MKVHFLNPDRAEIDRALRAADPRLRLARLADAAGVETLLTGVLAMEWPDLPDNIAANVRFMVEKSDRSFVVVLEDGGKLVAACGIHVLPDLLANHGQILIDDLVVDPRVRKAGLGSALLGGVLAVARTTAAWRVFMALDADNVKGRRLLEKHGLTDSGDRLWSIST